jgi:8-oxo-dGTP pyrophosphatase MutT (NUDIX family)
VERLVFEDRRTILLPGAARHSVRTGEIIDWAWRLAFRIGFRAMRLWWFIRRPHHEGALVAVWHEGRVLMVRQSYRPTWTFPGGRVEAGENARAAACRELAEELGLRSNRTGSASRTPRGTTGSIATTMSRSSIFILPESLRSRSMEGRLSRLASGNRKLC